MLLVSTCVAPEVLLHPDEVAEEPLRDIFLALLMKGFWWLELGVELVPLMVVEMWGNWGWGDWIGVLGFGMQAEVEGTPPAGLPALSLPESLSRSPLMLFNLSAGWPIFIRLQLGLTRYFNGRGPFLLHV